VRNITGVSLQDSKNWVENYHNIDINHPHDIPKSFESSSGLSSFKNKLNKIGKEFERQIRGTDNQSNKYSDYRDYNSNRVYVESEKYCNKWIALVLCYFLGLFGVHRFYEGDKKWGIIYLCTLGIFGYGWLFDMVRILFKPTRYPKKNR
jgi:hypothetical protein